VTQGPSRSDYHRAALLIAEAQRTGTYPDEIVQFSLEDEYDLEPFGAMGRACEKTRRAQQAQFEDAADGWRVR